LLKSEFNDKQRQAGYVTCCQDVWAYREVGIPMSRIFTVNHKGELRMEMPQAFLSSYVLFVIMYIELSLQLHCLCMLWIVQMSWLV